MSETMRVAVVVEIGRVEIQERPLPEPGEGEVLLRIRAVGICGSDKHYFSGRRAYEDSTAFPWVLGHEFAGDVVAIGAGVDTPLVGTRVTCDPDLPCGKCRPCKVGRANICPNVLFAGTPPREGALADYYVVNASQCHAIPGSMSFDAAVVHEPLAIGLHIVENLLKPQRGQTLAIIGSGTIGLCCVLAARLSQIGDIYVADRLDNRLALAAKFGATETFNVSTGDFAEFVRERTGGGADLVIEAAGETAAMQQGIDLAGNGGRIVIEGITDERMVPLDLTAARRRELNITVGRRSCGTARKALELIERNAFDIDAMITHHFPLEKTQRAMEITEALEDGVVKAIVNP